MWQRWNQTNHIFEKSVDNGFSWTPLGLNASIITEGTLPTSVLPANIAYKDQMNYFTQDQVIQKTAPTLYLQEAGVNFTIQHSAGYLRFLTTSSGQIFWMDFAGNTTITGAITVGLNSTFNQQVRVDTTQVIGGPPSLTDSTNSAFVVHTKSTVHADFGGLFAAPYTFWIQSKVNGQGNSYPIELNPLGGPVYTGADLIVRGALSTIGVIYPGRVDGTPGTQASWYLGSHASYGLYTNTSIFAAGGIQAAAWLRAGTNVYEAGRGNAMGVWADFTVGVLLDGVTAPTVNATYGMYMMVGNTFFYLVHANVSWPANYAFIRVNGIPTSVVAALNNFYQQIGRCYTGAAWESCYSIPGQGYIDFYRLGPPVNAQWQAGNQIVYLFSGFYRTV